MNLIPGVDASEEMLVLEQVAYLSYTIRSGDCDRVIDVFYDLTQKDMVWKR